MHDNLAIYSITFVAFGEIPYCTQRCWCSVSCCSCCSHLFALICLITIIEWHTIWSFPLRSFATDIVSCPFHFTFQPILCILCGVPSCGCACALFFFDYCYSIVASVYRIYKVLVGELFCCGLNIQSVNCKVYIEINWLCGVYWSHSG